MTEAKDHPGAISLVTNQAGQMLRLAGFFSVTGLQVKHHRCNPEKLNDSFPLAFS